MGSGGAPVIATPLPYRIFLSACIVMLAGCAQRGPAPLYLWETFAQQQYDTLKADGTNGGAEQIQVLEAHAEKARATNAQLPPGMRAHLGMLQLNSGNVTRARELWLAEKAAFPESAPYMDQLLKRMAGSGKTASKDKPA